MEQDAAITHKKCVSRDVLSVGLLIAFVLVFFHNILFPLKYLFGQDFILQFYPWKKFIYDNVWSHGSLPLWNPYLFSGSPFIANIQASMFYPLGFLYYLVSPEVAKFLDIAFDLRNKSDYRDFVIHEESIVRELLKESDNFIKVIKTLLKTIDIEE